MKKIKVNAKTYEFTELMDNASIDSLVTISPVDIQQQALDFNLTMFQVGAEKAEQKNEVARLEQLASIRKTKVNAILQRKYKKLKAEQKLTERQISAFVAEEIDEDEELIEILEQLAAAKLSYDHIDNIYWAIKNKATTLAQTRI